ncbi:hypothetical protein AJ80_01566 [Polytolypa hystricis UAMH7299]|uniref:CCAAT-binding factor domain-containing protein n=1 Tax=Polytolypa hystricis (strain UAMH7299) TaxID=1447883 RepID=A0A2B7Z058_POLH7|nr:hypothetical protein AJ80_01566 [Polytolypa hystricis UAMH7299]
MPGLVGGAQNSKKRKNNGKEPSKASSKRRAVAADDGEDEKENRIQVLEDQIAESRKYYNNIVTLLSMFDVESPNLEVALSLCRVFCRLLAGGHLNRPKNASEQDLILVAWLKERYQEYQNILISVLRNGSPSHQGVILSLCMRIIKEHWTHIVGSDVWITGFFSEVVEGLLEATNGGAVRAEFIEKFMKEYQDVAVYTVLRLSDYASETRPSEFVEIVISMLSEIGTPPPADHEFENFYADISRLSAKNKAPMTSVPSYKKPMQAAWLSVLRNSSLSPSQRKNLLRIMSYQIAPWFVKPELLMDFLTDSYNAGGSTSLLALSGLFYLIQEKNLDYPQFYPRLYSLLDANLLHSKHRSRFLRLMNTFLASTHLPASLVASFIKRLSRLALHAPPAAIVVIVPWIYNMMKEHPICTFMMHRSTITSPKQKLTLETHGIMHDPFNATEPDPSHTHALDSSLWEIVSLQSHYHPNVAAIAKIISEQFTKQAYNLEDFLDHSYQGMLEMELGKEERPFKNAPVVEFQIPKRIFTDRLLEEEDGEDGELGSLLRNLWDF